MKYCLVLLAIFSTVQAQLVHRPSPSFPVPSAPAQDSVLIDVPENDKNKKQYAEKISVAAPRSQQEKDLKSIIASTIAQRYPLFPIEKFPRMIEKEILRQKLSTEKQKQEIALSPIGRFKLEVLYQCIPFLNSEKQLVKLLKETSPELSPIIIKHLCYDIIFTAMIKKIGDLHKDIFKKPQDSGADQHNYQAVQYTYKKIEALTNPADKLLLTQTVAIVPEKEISRPTTAAASPHEERGLVLPAPKVMETAKITSLVLDKIAQCYPKFPLHLLSRRLISKEVNYHRELLSLKPTQEVTFAPSNRFKLEFTYQCLPILNSKEKLAERLRKMEPSLTETQRKRRCESLMQAAIKQKIKSIYHEIFHEPCKYTDHKLTEYYENLCDVYEQIKKCPDPERALLQEMVDFPLRAGQINLQATVGTHFPVKDNWVRY